MTKVQLEARISALVAERDALTAALERGRAAYRELRIAYRALEAKPRRASNFGANGYRVARTVHPANSR